MRVSGVEHRVEESELLLRYAELQMGRLSKIRGASEGRVFPDEANCMGPTHSYLNTSSSSRPSTFLSLYYLTMLVASCALGIPLASSLEPPVDCPTILTRVVKRLLPSCTRPLQPWNARNARCTCAEMIGVSPSVGAATRMDFQPRLDTKYSRSA